MSSLNNSLHIGARSLFTQQGGIATAGHNIANLNTEGFSRQEVQLRSESAQADGAGGGVKRGVPQRVFDRFTSRKIVHEESHASVLNTRERFLTKVEVVFNEMDGAGLRKTLNEFWDSWRLLANQPESDASRELVRDRADALAGRFRSMHEELHTIREEANTRAAGVVSEINALVSQIADLNRQVSTFENKDRVANDARDQRQLLLEKLAQKIDIQWLENSKGELKVSVGQTGWNLVDGRKAGRLNASLLGGETGMYQIQGIGKNEYRVDLTKELQSGELKEVLDIRDKTVVNHMKELDKLAFGLANQVNKLHASGTGLHSSFESIRSSGGWDPDAQSRPMPYLKDGILQFHLLDETGDVLETYDIEIQAGKDSLHDIVNRINNTVNDPLYLHAYVDEGGAVSFQAGGGKQFIFGEDGSDFLQIMGLNDFFETFSGAADFSVSDRIMEDPNMISTGKDLIPGDNQVALEIAKLQTQLTMENDTMTFDEHYNGIQTEVGLQIQRNQIEKEHQDSMLAQFKDIRSSISSVNMDEEVTKLVQYQKAYEASAKFVSTINEMMDTVLRM